MIERLNKDRLEGEAMRAKIKNVIPGGSDMVVDVRSLDYKYVFGYLPGSYERVKVAYDDVEFMFDSEWEKSIVKYREILHISLPKGVSPRFYAAVAYALEEYSKDEIRSVCIIRDVQEKARRKYWYKKIIVVINNTSTVIITAYGKEYSNAYNINIEETDSANLVFECKEEICRLKNVIALGMDQLGFYEKVLYNLENPGEKMNRAIGGR